MGRFYFIVFVPVLSKSASLCRLLSTTSNMRALVNGWKALDTLLTSVTDEGRDLMVNGALDLSRIVEELTFDVEEGLQVLSTLEVKNYQVWNALL